MLIVIPVCSKDEHLAIRNIEYSKRILGRKLEDTSALVSHDDSFDPSKVIEAAKNYFRDVCVLKYAKWMGESRWPFPQNHAWQKTARYIETTLYSIKGWFWWEADAVPLKSDWVQIIREAHETGKRPFTGAVATMAGVGYMAGVGVYPPNISEHVKHAMISQSNPWDITAGQRDNILNRTHDISPLICHTPSISNTRFSTYSDVGKWIPETAVLFHKCKDGTLLDVLEGRPIDTLSVNHADAQSALPSFTEQTNWETGLFTFPLAANTCYFNPSIVMRGEQRLLLTRRYRWNKEQSSEGREQGSGSDLVIWPLRKNLTVEPNPIIPSIATRHIGEQFEDPKAVESNGRIYVGMANWVHHKKWPVRQAFLRLGEDMRTSQPALEMNFSGNRAKIEDGTSPEKNWNPFFVNGSWHFVYKTTPHVVVKMSDPQETFKSPVPEGIWTFGEPRGGTPPILCGNEYISFFHSSRMWQMPKRRYYMGAYAFASKPPYNVTRMTISPLLTGSENDFRVLGGPLVVFPNGAILEDMKFTVVMGINDEACGFIKIPFEDLDELMMPI